MMPPTDTPTAEEAPAAASSRAARVESRAAPRGLCQLGAERRAERTPRPVAETDQQVRAANAGAE